MSERKEGWYWVKASDDHHWECCQYEFGDGWWIDELGCSRPEGWFPVVGPRIPTPDENWQCVPKEPTEEMMEACSLGVSAETKGVYQVMVAAAPSPGDT